MIDRRTVICIITAALLRPVSALGQGTVKVTIGWIAVGSIPSNIAAFREMMKQLGYVEGKNFVIVERYANTPEQFAAVLDDLVHNKVNLVVATGAVATRAARSGTAKIPIVFLTTDPVGTGLVTSLARPDGNLTGVAILTQDFNAKRVEIIVSMLPTIRKLAALNDRSGALSAKTQAVFGDESEAAARRLGIQIVAKIDVRNIDEIDAAFATAVKAGAGAMLTVSSSYFNAHEQRLVSAAAKAHLPTIYEHRDFVEAGGLVSYGPNLRDAFRIAGSYADKILKGARPSDLPVEQASRLELVINQRTARALGLTIPQPLLLRADEVIQ